MAKKFSLVIPCYNEEKNIPLLLERINTAVGESVLAPEEFELVLVENGSHDNSRTVMRELMPKYPFFKMEIVEVNEGYGHGIKQGLRAATGNYVGVCHADLQTDPFDAFRAYAIVSTSEQPLLVKGDRKGRPWQAVLISRLFELATLVILQRYIREINAQPKVFTRKLLPLLEDAPKNLCFDVYVMIQAAKLGLKTRTIDVIFPERIHGESSWSFSFSSKVRTMATFFLFLLKYRFCARTD